MNNLDGYLVYVFVGSILPVMAIFIGYPLFLWLNTQKQQADSKDGNVLEELPNATLVFSVRNGEKLITDKINNCLALNYPKDRLSIIVFSDGSTDQTLALLQSYKETQLTVLSSIEHVGKANALNLAVSQSKGELLFFTDADAMLDKNALHHLAEKLAEQDIGGVSGLRVIEKEHNELKAPQKTYIKLDSWIKIQESRQGSTTSNDGKLYGIKRNLFIPIAEGVTDDLYSALCIVAQGKRFIFEPLAIARIKIPSRNLGHEAIRRRRITCRSFQGISLNRQLLNPFKFGSYAIALLVNKIFRRLLPIFLMLIFFSNLFLTNVHPLFIASLLAQILFYSLPLVIFLPIKNAPIQKIGNAILYLCIGNIGMLLGIYDYATGKKTIKWDPVKND